MGNLIFARNAYTTAFPLTENPMSESGQWINGGTTGLDWLDVRCTPGLAFGTGSSPSPPYNDPTAVLSGGWRRTQTVEAVVVVPASPSQFQEVELRLLTTITPHRIVGYECNYSVVSGNHYVEIIRWDGTTDLSSFVSLTGGPVFPASALVTGNRVKATVTVTGLITAYADYGSGYVQVAQGTDTTYRDGAPGIGFYNSGAGSIADFGLSQFRASAV